MAEFTKSYPAGRMIARLFAQVGWGIVLLGLLLAIAGGLLGRMPGTDAGLEGVTTLGRVAGAMPGAGIVLFGLFAVMMAAQTRASLDSADIAREMLALARGRSAGLTAAQSAVAPIVSAAGRAEPLPPVVADERVPPAPIQPAAARLRFPAAVSQAEHRRDPKPDLTPETRPEPRFAAVPKVAPTTPTTAAKIHPIFSARPPR